MALRDALLDADAVLVSTPEYNGSIPGALKNAVDWASRPMGASALTGRPFAVIGASPSPFGAAWAQAELRKVLAIAGARVLEKGASLGKAPSRLDADGRLADDDPVRPELVRRAGPPSAQPRSTPVAQPRRPPCSRVRPGGRTRERAHCRFRDSCEGQTRSGRWDGRRDAGRAEDPWGCPGGARRTARLHRSPAWDGDLPGANRDTEHAFDRVERFTIGIEEELMLVDPVSLDLRPAVADVLERTAGDGRFEPELRPSQVEILTPVARSAADAGRALADARRDLAQAADGIACVMAAGTHPRSEGRGEVTTGDRYRAIADEYAWAAERSLACGLHVHVAVGGAREALAVTNAADTQTRVDDATAVASLFRALVVWLTELHDAGEPLPSHPAHLIRENAWRAHRYGVRGWLVDLDTGEPIPTRESISHLIDPLEPVATRFGGGDEVDHARTWSGATGPSASGTSRGEPGCRRCSNGSSRRRRAAPPDPMAAPHCHATRSSTLSGMSDPTYLKPPADGFETRYPETRFDALLVVSFGGPEGMDDVIPFLENVTRGRGDPARAARGGRAPLRAVRRRQPDQRAEPRPDRRAPARARRARDRPADLLRQPELGPVPRGHAPRRWRTTASSARSRSSPRRTRATRAAASTARTSTSRSRRSARDAPEVLKLRMFFNHPGFVEANADHLREALARIPAERRATTHVAFTAHSIPEAMARACRYEQQLAETARLVSEAVGVTDTALVWQSRSGPPLDAVARARRQRPSRRGRRARRHRRRARADRLRLGPPRDPLRPRRRGGRDRSRPRHRARAREDGLHASGLRLDDPRADPGAPRPGRREARARHASPRATTRARSTAAGPAAAARLPGTPDPGVVGPRRRNGRGGRLALTRCGIVPISPHDCGPSPTAPRNPRKTVRAASSNPDPPPGEKRGQTPLVDPPRSKPGHTLRNRADPSPRLRPLPDRATEPLQDGTRRIVQSRPTAWGKTGTDPASTATTIQAGHTLRNRADLSHGCGLRAHETQNGARRIVNPTAWGKTGTDPDASHVGKNGDRPRRPATSQGRDDPGSPGRPAPSRKAEGTAPRPYGPSPASGGEERNPELPGAPTMKMACPAGCSSTQAVTAAATRRPRQRASSPGRIPTARSPSSRTSPTCSPGWRRGAARSRASTRPRHSFGDKIAGCLASPYARTALLDTDVFLRGDATSSFGSSTASTSQPRTPPGAPGPASTRTRAASFPPPSHSSTPASSPFAGRRWFGDSSSAGERSSTRARITCHDQPAFRAALYESGASLSVLPPEWNALTGAAYYAGPVQALHAHGLSDTDAERALARLDEVTGPRLVTREGEVLPDVVAVHFTTPEALTLAAAAAAAPSPGVVYSVPARADIPGLLEPARPGGPRRRGGRRGGEVLGADPRDLAGARPVSVDPWLEAPADEYVDIANVPQRRQEEFLATTRARLAPFGQRSEIWRMTGDEAAARLPDGALDFVYLDARHDYDSVVSDLAVWLPKIAPGGIIAGHDSIDGDLPEGVFGVRSAVDGFFGARGLHVGITTTEPSTFPSWIVRVPARPVAPLPSQGTSAGSGLLIGLRTHRAALSV